MPTFRNNVSGFEEITRQLSAMVDAAGGKILRSAVRSAMTVAKREAKAAAPVGDPPYFYAGASSGEAGYSYGAGESVDPYPRKTHKGLLVTPGFTSRSVILKTKLSRDKRTARALLGVEAQAWASVVLVELGTSTIPARPWLEPSFRRSVPQINARLKQQLRAKIDKASRI